MLLAATNRPTALDPALLRPGRLSRKVVVPLPDEQGRRAILGVHLRGVPLEGAADAAAAAAAAVEAAAAEATAAAGGVPTPAPPSALVRPPPPPPPASQQQPYVLTAAEAAARVAAVTPGFNGAELANVVNEASLLAARAGKSEVGMLELLEGVRRQRFGVDGGGSGAGGDGGDGPLAGLRKSFGSWLLDAASGGAASRRVQAGTA